MANSRTCYICGKSYQYCPTCGNDRNKPSWYSSFCSETCKNINDTLSGEHFGRIPIGVAANTLRTLGVPSMEIKDGPVKVMIDKILGNSSKVAVAPTETVAALVAETDAETSDTETDDNEDSKKSYFSKKRSWEKRTEEDTELVNV